MAEVIEAPPAEVGSAIPPKSSAEIPVSQLATSQLRPIKPGSARSRMYEQLEKNAKPPPGQAPVPAATTPATPTPAATPRPGATEQEDETPDPNAPTIEEEQTPPVDPGKAPEADKRTPPAEKGKKPSPWKLMEQFKERAARAEQELLDVRKQLVPEQERKVLTDRLSTIESRNKELEDEIRHVNYSKSAEFQKEYQKPYEEAWKRAVSELKEIPFTDPQTQQARAATPDDLLQLVNLPLAQARELANTYFGDFADDVMAHRKEIKSLFDKQSSALEEAKKTGGEREQQRMAEFTKAQTELKNQIKSLWDTVNAKALEDPKYGHYFKPKEGDDEWNSRLQKGFALVDRAFTEQSHNPKLTAEERAAIIKRHAAVRNRAAGWSALRHYATKLEKELADLKKELDGYKGTTPPTGGSIPGAPATNGGSARDRMYSSLQKIAKPL